MPIEPDLIAVGGVVSAILLSIVGLAQYRASIHLRRAEWLYELYNEFYVDEQKKLVRDQLDSPSGREIVGAIMTKKEEALTTEEAALLSQFCDYLNFFEFMIVLKKNGALRDRDIIDMFDYYLRSLLKINGIVFYLKDNGFAHLSEQLTEMSRVATA